MDYNDLCFDIYEGSKLEIKNNSLFPTSVNGPSFVGLIVGIPGSGKSTLLSKLLQTDRAFYKKYDLVLFISPTQFDNLKLYADRYTSNFNIEWVYDRLEYFYKKKSIQNCLIIMDDIAGSLKEAERDKMWINLFNNRRHYKIHEKADKIELSFLISTQKYTGIPLVFRNISEFIILFQPSFKEFQTIKNETAAVKGIKQHDFEISCHYKKKKYNFIYILRNPYKLYLNFEKRLI